MCQHLGNKKFKEEDDYFNSKLYFDLGKYNNEIQETFDNIEPITDNNQNGKYLTQCLSKDLLDTIDAFIIENEPKKNNIKTNDFSNFLFDETTDTSIITSSYKNDSFEDNYVNSNAIKELIPLMNQKYSFIPKNFINKNNNNKSKKNFKGREGDWICFYCNNLNYSFRKVCNRCHVSKEISQMKSNKFNSKK